MRRGRGRGRGSQRKFGRRGPDEIFEHLQAVFHDPNRRQNARRQFANLRMKTYQKYNDFLAEFMRLAGEAGFNPGDYKDEMYDKITSSLRNLVIGQYYQTENFNNLRDACHQAAYALQPSVIRSAGHSRLHGRITSDAMPTKAVPMPFHACNFEAVSSNLPWDKQPKNNLCDGFPVARMGLSEGTARVFGRIKKLQRPWIPLNGQFLSKGRVVVDIRGLNRIVEPDAYPIPLQDDILALINGKACISVFDAISIFYQWRTHPDHRNRLSREGVKRRCSRQRGIYVEVRRIDGKVNSAEGSSKALEGTKFDKFGALIRLE
ncbi:hypothetical protein DTO063F5_328 [Paecilomyces variotii]|nr:hypothetical protein DTO063F5_328 [Paecilomyces variotii]